MLGVGVGVDVGGRVGRGVGVSEGTDVDVAVLVGDGGSGVAMNSFSTSGVWLAGIGVDNSVAHPVRKKTNKIIKRIDFSCCIIPYKSCYSKNKLRSPYGQGVSSARYANSTFKLAERLLFNQLQSEVQSARNGWYRCVSRAPFA